MTLKKQVSLLTTAAALIAVMIAAPSIADGHKKGGGKFKESDTNADGMLSKEEMQAQQAKRLDKMFSTADVNSDGFLSKEELAAHRKNRRAHKAHKESK